MRELRSGIRRGHSVTTTVGEEGKQQEHDDRDVGGEVTTTINVLETANYNNHIIFEEKPEEDQRIRTSPSIPYENAGIRKLEYLDILLNIIVRLPVKSILRFRCVSKAWCKLLKDPQFVREHPNHAIEMNRFSVMILSYETFFAKQRIILLTKNLHTRPLKQFKRTLQNRKNYK
ncbi:hypothetical protein MKX03_026340 [Papaver bracteatum]|nr:hypothetical protein MKX03_026340 [Papaver bracteatum]